MLMCLLDGIELPPNLKEELEQKGYVIKEGDDPKCGVVVIRNKTLANKDFIDAHKHLKHIIRAGVGLDNVDVDYAYSKGIKVYNAPGSNAFSVAELFFFHMLNALRKGCSALDYVKGHYSFNRQEFFGTNVKGKCIGIIGTGNIGKDVIKRLQGWDVKILAYDVYENQELIEGYGIKYVPLKDIFEQCDVVGVFVPLLPSTEHMINKDLISKAKGVVLINLSRGKVVDEHAVLEGLNNGSLLAYCADVVYDESNLQSIDLKLISHPKAYISPHIGAHTKESLSEMVSVAIKNFLAHRDIKSKH